MSQVVGRTCAACGYAVGEQDRFCEHCSEPLTIDEERPPRRRRWWLVAVPAVLVVAAAVVAAVLLWPRQAPTAAPSPTPCCEPVPTPGPTVVDPTATPGPATPAPQLLDDDATAEASATAPDNKDGTGQVVTYAASNTLDGDPSTAWRMEGSGVGAQLAFTFDAPRTVTTLGLVNGYAKIDPVTGDDRYAQERRILSVTWSVEGRQYDQQLEDGDRGFQDIHFAPVTTSRIGLRIDDVSEPGDVNFDRTPISDVLIGGR